jgi:hypothetical protein
MYRIVKLEFNPHNGLELSCPAEAGSLSRIVRLAGGPGKIHSRPSPPGQLQRVVGRHEQVEDVRLPFVRVQWACYRHLLERQRMKPNGLLAKQDQDTSSNGEDRHDYG